jgi:hypothetical protein
MAIRQIVRNVRLVQANACLHAGAVDNDSIPFEHGSPDAFDAVGTDPLVGKQPFVNPISDGIAVHTQHLGRDGQAQQLIAWPLIWSSAATC